GTGGRHGLRLPRRADRPLGGDSRRSAGLARARSQPGGRSRAMSRRAGISGIAGIAGMPGGRPRLPAVAINALADLVAAGFGMAEALSALPRESLRRMTARQLEAEL